MAGTLISVAGGLYASDAQSNQLKYQAQVAEQNAQLEDRARLDAISRGETEQRNHYRRLAQAMGEARVKNAAAGLDVGFGSAASLEEDIALIGWEDSQTIAENTTKEVQGYDIRAANYRNEGKAAKMQAKAAKTSGYISAAGTLLSSASQIASTNMSKGNNWYGGPKKGTR